MSSYLDKYLEKKPKKEKSGKVKSSKSKKFMGAGLRIVDTDTTTIPTRTKSSAVVDPDDIFNDQLADADELPQIANFIDERPTEIKVLEQFRQGDKWKTVESSDTVSKKTGRKNSSDSQTDSDNSPPRLHQSRRRDRSPKNLDNSNSDLSPSRAENKSKNRQDYRERRDRGRKENSFDSDNSPPRRRRKGATPDSDVSPPRPRKNSSDASKRSHNNGPNQIQSRSKHSTYSTSKRKHSDSDNSPPRSRSRRKSSPEASSKSSLQNKTLSLNQSRRQKRHSSDSDISPPRQRQIQNDRQTSTSSNSHRPGSSEQSRNRGRNRQVSESPPPTHKGKETKTLDGKKAGLQTAGALKGELEHIRRLENERFNQMEDEISGRYAKTKVRDRQTGKERDFQAELEKKMEEDEKVNQRKAQYDKWGKGLKQVQDQEERVSSALHEMSKPLARYKDDDDLDEHLKNQDRDGDPMLAFLTKKKKKASSGPAKPMYQGPPPPPNRFGILPGYRWDGVDRSNGYEKEWFGKINARKALQDESYKWSVEDL